VSREIKRGDVWSLPDDGLVLVVSLTGLDDAYGAVLAIVLHPAGRYPDTAMSVVIDKPLPATAVAVNLQQLRSTRLADATHRGTVEAATMARVDQALRAVLDLYPWSHTRDPHLAAPPRRRRCSS
jgi:mRNA interferase MazF